MKRNCICVKLIKLRILNEYFLNCQAKEDGMEDREYNYDDYEKEVERTRQRNNELLELFRSDLEAKGLAEKTINRHISNVDFYINESMLTT